MFFLQGLLLAKLPFVLSNDLLVKHIHISFKDISSFLHCPLRIGPKWIVQSLLKHVAAAGGKQASLAGRSQGSANRKINWHSCPSVDRKRERSRKEVGQGNGQVEPNLFHPGTELQFW